MLSPTLYLNLCRMLYPNQYHKNDSIHEEGAHKFTVNKTFREKLKKMSEG